GGHPVAQLGGDWLEVGRSSKLHGTEAPGHLAFELRDVTLLGCLDEDSLNAERLQPGRNRSAAFEIALNSRHHGTLRARPLELATPRRSRTCDRGAFMEQSGGNRWQPVAKRTGSKTAQISQNGCHRLPLVACTSIW